MSDAIQIPSVIGQQDSGATFGEDVAGKRYKKKEKLLSVKTLRSGASGVSGGSLCSRLAYPQLA